MRPETVTEAEIQSYLDNELDLGRRLAVERHLARDPDAAARFMADLGMRTSLRFLASHIEPPPEAMIRAADRLSVRLSARSSGLGQIFGGRSLRLLAAAAILAAIAIPARNVVAGPPDYVGEAVEAYRTGLLRAAMASQIETPRFDAGEVQRSTHIRIPRLPARWVVTDAQIFPTDQGPALHLMVSTPDAETMSILAVRTPTEAPEQPMAVRHEGTSVAYWREGETSYALTGEAEPEAVDLAAEDIADNGGSSLLD